MDIGLNTLAAIASISGYSFRDIFHLAKSKKNSEIFLKSISTLLSALDQNNDHITGIWTLEKANYTYERHSYRYVSGNLAILFHTKSENKWHARATFEYRKNHSRFVLFPSNGNVAHFFGACITGIYDITLYKKSSDEFEGESEMIYANPSRHIKDIARIQSLTTENNKMQIRFENTNTTGVGDYYFSMRKKWADIVNETLVFSNW